MSASAGRVLIIPKGDYNSATTYNMLDMVFYGGKSYICKQTSTGNVPTNTVYWQIMIDGASEFSALSDVELNNLQDGEGIYWDATAQKWKNTTPTSIAITSPPATVDYSAGDLLDLTGIVVTVYYAGGSSKNITSECTFSPANGTTLTTSNTSVTVTWRTFSATQAITVKESLFGVEWEASSSPAWTRTDGASSFVDPVPYYSGMSETPSSPFDNISPWKDMQIVEDSNAGTLVSIPKFWYKVEALGNYGGLKIQISTNSAEGFHVSPAHMDRGDGQGERDVVYIGRYHCGSTACKSATGQTPMNNQYRSTFRSMIHNLGTDIWQADFAMRFTIWLLYIVEFANWNSQEKIGYGCANNNSGVANMGYTDSMPYHTGTTKSSRTTYGYGTQYRYIEGLWDNVYDWIDGCYYDSNYNSLLSIILNPANFSDSSSGTQIAQRNSSGYASQFKVFNVPGTFNLFLPTYAGGSSGTTYLCDYWESSKPCLACGGYYAQQQEAGLFSIKTGSPSTYDSIYGSRLMKLPANS